MPNARIGFMPGIINIKCLKELTNGWGFMIEHLGMTQAPAGIGAVASKTLVVGQSERECKPLGDHLWLCVRDSAAWNVLPSGSS